MRKSGLVHLVPTGILFLIIMGGMMMSVLAFDMFSHRQGNRPEIFEGGDLSAIKKTYPRSSLLQQEMMDFSDRYTMAIWQALDEYLRTETTPLKRSAAEQWKVLFSAASMEIAAERETAASLLDMAVFINLSDWVVRNYWVPEVFGPAGKPLIAAHRQMKKDMDAILSGALSPLKREQLSSAIEAWKKEHPKSCYVADIRLRDLATVRGAKDQWKGAFPVLGDLRHALGRVDDAFQYGERMMFYIERLSRILTMQTSLTIAQTGASPSIISLTQSADAASSALEKLPGTLSATLQTNASTIQGLLPGLQTTLADTKSLAESLERIQKARNEHPTDQPWTPDKTTAALGQFVDASRELNGTLKQRNSMLTADEQGKMPALQLVNETHAKTRATIDDIFQKCLILLGVLLAGMAGLIVIFRRLPKR